MSATDDDDIVDECERCGRLFKTTELSEIEKYTICVATLEILLTVNHQEWRVCDFCKNPDSIIQELRRSSQKVAECETNMEKLSREVTAVNNMIKSLRKQRGDLVKELDRCRVALTEAEDTEQHLIDEIADPSLICD